MFQVLTMSVAMIVALIALNAFLGGVAGVDSGGSEKVFEAIIIIVLLYIVMIALFGSNMSSLGVPFLEVLGQYQGISDLFHRNLPLFILECAGLISLVFIINLVSQFVPSTLGGSGLSGQILRSVVLVALGLTVNHYVLGIVSDMPLFQWALTILECFISSAALLVTPAMVLGKLLGVSSESGLVSFLIEELPKTKVGAAMSSAATNSLLLVCVVMLFESQFGNLQSMLLGVPLLINAIGPIVIMLIAYRLMIKSLFK